MEQDQINPFKKVGIVLLIIGIIDIGFMAYCIANKTSYSSSFNIFAVIAGIFLLKGGVKTARVVRWFSIFGAVGFTGVLILVPATMPFTLLSAQIKLHALSMLGSFLFGILLIAILIWVYQQLSTPASLHILSQAGFNTGPPKSAYLAGVILLVLILSFSLIFLNGESAQKAKALAQEQLGPNYNYHVVSISTSGNSGRATVTAYTSIEIKNVQVQW